VWGCSRPSEQKGVEADGPLATFHSSQPTFPDTPQPDVTLRIDAGGVPLKVTFKGKNFRKSMKAVIPGCFVVIQGRLASGGEIIDPGIVLQPPKPVPAPAPAPAEAA